MKRPVETLENITRRHFFLQGGLGIGSAALASLLGEEVRAASGADAPGPKPHFAPRAKNVIYLFMSGGPSQVDLFEHKPRLTALDGQPIPDGFLKGERFAFIKGKLQLMGSPYSFKRCGQSGASLSDLLPHTAGIVDDIAIIRSMYSEHFNHAPAQLFVNTGHNLPGRPSMGSWLSYGIGSENRDLPGFVVLQSGHTEVFAGNSCWGCGFLPTQHQGVEFRSQGDPVLYVSSPDWMVKEVRRRSLDALERINRIQYDELGDPEIMTRIASYELAYRMQTSVPELMDISKESEATHRLYGTEPGKVSFANNCMLARRLVERGVRFIQLYHHGWDHHGEGPKGTIAGPSGLAARAKQVDQASAALIKDLKQRGLLDTTLVLWGGEFGRTPICQNPGKYPGRDHHPYAFTVWAAGGGIKPGVTIGETDEIGYRVVADKVDVHDLHATLLHQLGIDHKKLVYKFKGREFRLTDVGGNVVEKLLA